MIQSNYLSKTYGSGFCKRWLCELSNYWKLGGKLGDDRLLMASSSAKLYLQKREMKENISGFFKEFSLLLETVLIDYSMWSDVSIKFKFIDFGLLQVYTHSNSKNLLNK